MENRDYLQLLHSPLPEARVRTRWWWYGCRVREEDIVYQLDRMHDAGIGGVEIQITYPLQAGDDNLEYFSPAFFRILQFTAGELKKRGMTMDLTLGSSWPFGGPFVPFVKSAVTVIPLELTVEGPCVFEYDLTNRISGEVVGCVMGQMEGSAMLPETLRDISGHLADRLLYNWPWGTKIAGVEVPAGLWKIVLFVASQFREHVLMPTRGAGGYVIDHNSREAMRFFLEHAGTPIVERLGKGTVQDFFCDSLEVFGHNWTSGIYREFEARRGYRLQPYIYALWGNIRGLTEEVRYDFHRTLSELTVEGFFQEMTDWCREVGSKSRIQAHGTWGDVLLTYGAADVPEGETFSEWDKFSVNTVHRRLASSAGHLYHKKIISNESFTWLRFPRFTETLEQIKIAADSIFMDGMNQIVNHGYSYSPREGEPLYFYASSTISHTNTWWKYYHHIARYLARVCTFLQRGEPAADMCIYLPQADIWAEEPLGDVHMCMKLEEKIGSATVDALAHRGYWFDYINDEALCRWEEYGYKTLLIMETDHMPAETVEKVRSFAQAGNLVICAGRMPSKDCGMNHHADVAGAFARMKAQGLVTLTEDKGDSLLQCLCGRVVPDLCVAGGDGEGDIGYVHRRDDGAEIYFVANMSLREHRAALRIRLPASDGHAARVNGGLGAAADGAADAWQLLMLDPMEGCQVCPDRAAAGAAAGPEGLREFMDVEITFRPGQSFILILRRASEACPTAGAAVCPAADAEACPAAGAEACPAAGAPGPANAVPDTLAADLSAGFELSVPEKGFCQCLPALEGFEKIPALRYYAGEAVYSRRFTLRAEDLAGTAGEGHPGTRLILCAEQVETAAAVYVNGVHMTDWIMRPYEADVTAALREGENEIRILVSNRLINRFLDPEYDLPVYPDKIMDHWPYFPQELIKERGKRLDAWREREMVRELFPSGLIGQVRIMRRKGSRRLLS